MNRYLFAAYIWASSFMCIPAYDGAVVEHQPMGRSSKTMPRFSFETDPHATTGVGIMPTVSSYSGSLNPNGWCDISAVLEKTKLAREGGLEPEASKVTWWRGASVGKDSRLPMRNVDIATYTKEVFKSITTTAEPPRYSVTGAPTWTTGTYAFMQMKVWELPKKLYIVGTNGKVLVEIDLRTGKAKLFGNPNKAAKIFWEAVRRMR